MEEMKLATPDQLKALHAVLHRKGLLKHKSEIVSGVTNGRASSSKELTIEECRDLLDQLNDYQPKAPRKDKTGMIRKLFAMAHEIGWIKKRTEVIGGSLVATNDNSRVYQWVEKYGYLKKPLRSYTYEELPKLISAFEFHIYKPYLDRLNQTKTT